jgi:putative endonuclease
MKKIILGKIGEDIACKYLLEKGYKIIARNHREKSDEIDIIAIAGDKTLVFIEVKTMQGPINSSFGIVPEDQLTSDKFRKISRVCVRFSSKHPDLIDDEKGWRIDLVAITLMGDSEDDFESAHYENI